MTGLAPAGFFSYVRLDDDHDDGALTAFRRQLQGELRAQLGEEFAIFQDRDDLLWGQAWRARINAAVDTTTVLIPVVTPSFFKSAPCRDELERFLKREAALGRDDLVFPLYYIESPLLENEALREADVLAKAVHDHQYKDWRELRFQEIKSLDVKRAVAALASEIVVALSRTPTDVPPATVDAHEPTNDDDEEPGVVEQVYEVFEGMTRLTENLDAMTQVMVTMQDATEAATADIERANQPGKPPGAALAAVRRYKEALEPIATDYEALSSAYVEVLTQIDAGLHPIIRRAAAEATEPDEWEAVDTFFNSVLEMVDNARENETHLAGLTTSIEGTLQYSSTTRPTLRRLIAAFERTRGTLDIYESWASEIADVRETNAASGAAAAVESEDGPKPPEVSG